jgi:hypothetical protein
MKLVGWSILVCVVWAVALAPSLLAVRLRGPLTRRRVLGASLLAAAIVLAVHVASLDGVDGLIFSRLMPGHTEYASSYSEFGFRRIRLGMNPADVIRVAGEPLGRYGIEYDPTLIGWSWSRTPDGSSYHVRVVLFRNGSVVDKIAEYYVD